MLKTREQYSSWYLTDSNFYRMSVTFLSIFHTQCIRMVFMFTESIESSLEWVKSFPSAQFARSVNANRFLLSQTPALNEQKFDFEYPFSSEWNVFQAMRIGRRFPLNISIQFITSNQRRLMFAQQHQHHFFTDLLEIHKTSNISSRIHWCVVVFTVIKCLLFFCFRRIIRWLWLIKVQNKN